jgi:aromatase
MHTSIGIWIAVPPQTVLDLARDVGRWPELLPHYRSVRVHSRRGDRVVATMRAVRPLGPLRIPVTWRAVCWPDTSDSSHLRLEFRHVRGITAGMKVTWHIRPLGDGSMSEVRIVHDFRRRLPLLGADALPRFVDRLFTQPIASRTLATFREVIESDDRSPAATPGPGRFARSRRRSRLGEGEVQPP